MLLEQAEALGEALLPAFDTRTGAPSHAIIPATKERLPGKSGPQFGLAELGSCQMVRGVSSSTVQLLTIVFSPGVQVSRSSNRETRLSTSRA